MKTYPMYLRGFILVFTFVWALAGITFPANGQSGGLPNLAVNASHSGIPTPGGSDHGRGRTPLGRTGWRLPVDTQVILTALGGLNRVDLAKQRSTSAHPQHSRKSSFGTTGTEPTTSPP